MKYIIFMLCAALLSGCASLSSRPESLAASLKLAAFVGTSEALREHPEWAAGFRRAAEDLKIIEQADAIDFATITAIALRLPVKELKSERAVLYITAAGLMLESVSDQVDLGNTGQARLVAGALRSGIERALPPP